MRWETIEMLNQRYGHFLDDDDFRDVLADFYLRKMYSRLRSEGADEADPPTA